MSLEQMWNEMNDDKDKDLLSVLIHSRSLKRTSKDPLMKIKQNLLINIAWGILICIGYVAVIIFFNSWPVQLCIGIVLLFSVWTVFTAWQQYKKLEIAAGITGTVLQEMKKHYHSVKVWMNTQQRVALFIYPVSAAGGFFLGGMLGSGKPVEYFMYKPVFILSLLGCIVVLVPVCYYVARWMFQYSFGKYLLVLQQNITALEEEK